MKLSIITNCYNSYEVAKTAIESVARNTVGEYEHIIIDNHSPDERTREYIAEYANKNSNVVLIDEGRNLGCHGGLNAGFDVAKGEYVVKRDDDCEMISHNWQRMLEAFSDNVVFLAPWSNVVRTGNQHTNFDSNGYKILKPLGPMGIVNFSICVIKKSFIDAHPRFENDKLYGGEEHWYRDIAVREGLDFGYIEFPRIEFTHASNDDRDFDYVVRKYCHGYNIISESLEEMKANKEILKKSYMNYYGFCKKNGNDWGVNESLNRLRSMGI